MPPFDVIGNGHVKSEISQTFPLSETADAHRALESRRRQDQLLPFNAALNTGTMRLALALKLTEMSVGSGSKSSLFVAEYAAIIATARAFFRRWSVYVFRNRKIVIALKVLELIDKELMGSTTPIGLRMRRNAHIFDRVPLSTSSSSFAYQTA